MFKTKIVSLATITAMMFLMCTSLLSEALIADHTAVQRFDEIPAKWLEAARQFTLHYAHTSHGMQIISGLKYIEEQIDGEKYNVALATHYANHPDPATALPSEETLPALRIADTGRKPDGYWASESGLNETRGFAATGLYDFSMFGWCSELSGSLDLTDYIDNYLNTMTALENEFPTMRFIYQTGHSDGYPSYSKLRENNDRIRAYCTEHDKILFDFADIENWDPDGNFYPENYNCSWCEEWCQNHPDDCVNIIPACESGIPSCCPHTHGYNCYIKAKAFWYLMARLAGWDGSIPLPVELVKFHARIIKGGVELVWRTATEKNNYGFEILRRYKESGNFEKIGFVMGHGTTNKEMEYSLIDKDAKSGMNTYRLKQIDTNGSFEHLGEIQIWAVRPNEFYLYQNYPNPFNATTTISYTIPQNNHVELAIYDINSNEVITLVDKYQNAGSYYISWRADEIASGLYHCCLRSGDLIAVRKMLIIK